MNYLPEGFIEDNTSEEMEAAVNWYIKKYGTEPRSPSKALDEYIEYFETHPEEE